MKSVMLIDYDMGNITSVANAFEVAGCDVKISRDPAEIANAERLVLPGVGAFGEGIEPYRCDAHPCTQKSTAIYGDMPRHATLGRSRLRIWGPCRVNLDSRRGETVRGQGSSSSACGME